MDRMSRRGVYPINGKLQASSLVETIVATVLIMIVFGIAMASVTRVLEQTVQNSTHAIDTELDKLSYQYLHGLIRVPEFLDIDQWTIEIQKKKEGQLHVVVFKATHRKRNKVRTKQIIVK